MRNEEGSARNTLEELIEERDDSAVPIDQDERTLLANILELRGNTVRNVMVPRADVVAIDGAAPLIDVIQAMTLAGHSRLPVYRETLDDAVGMVHIKDVLAWRGQDEAFALAKIVRKVLFVAPSMQVLELLLEMRVTRSHMALVVDEFGGVDGLVTIEDLVEEIVGEIEDEHDRGLEPRLIERTDGTLDADARVTVETLEARVGPLLSDEEREVIASEIKEMDDEEFSAYSDKLAILLNSKNKTVLAKAEEAKAAEEQKVETTEAQEEVVVSEEKASEEEVVEDAVDQAEQAGEEIPVTTAAEEPTVQDKYKDAFSIENFEIKI